MLFLTKFCSNFLKKFAQIFNKSLTIFAYFCLFHLQDWDLKEVVTKEDEIKDSHGLSGAYIAYIQGNQGDQMRF
jgi:hypothetical protein